MHIDIAMLLTGWQRAVGCAQTQPCRIRAFSSAAPRRLWSCLASWASGSTSSRSGGRSPGYVSESSPKGPDHRKSCGRVRRLGMSFLPDQHLSSPQLEELDMRNDRPRGSNRRRAAWLFRIPPQVTSLLLQQTHKAGMVVPCSTEGELDKHPLTCSAMLLDPMPHSDANPEGIGTADMHRWVGLGGGGVGRGWKVREEEGQEGRRRKGQGTAGRGDGQGGSSSL